MVLHLKTPTQKKQWVECSMPGMNKYKDAYPAIEIAPEDNKIDGTRKSGGFLSTQE